MSIDPQSLRPGYQLQHFTLERVIGQGGFGITYLAQDRQLERQVAIKEYFPRGLAQRNGATAVVTPSESDKPAYQHNLQRFVEEARTLARFDHPNIIRVFGFFAANNTAYMVMPYERGQTLQVHLRQGSAEWPEPRIRRLALPLLAGLTMVHQTGFLHRDIKPGNIYLRQDDTPVLLDFGAARQALLSQSQHMTALVSLGFAPPEQYATQGQWQGPWSDLYALGATLYRCIGGTGPADAMARLEALRHSVPDPMPPAADIGAGRYSPALLSAIDHMLDPRHRVRPQTATEVIELLGAAGANAGTNRGAADHASETGNTTTVAPAKTTPERNDPAPGVAAGGDIADTPVATDRQQQRWPLALAGLLAVAASAATIPLAPTFRALLSHQIALHDLPWRCAVPPSLLALTLASLWYHGSRRRRYRRPSVKPVHVTTGRDTAAETGNAVPPEQHDVLARLCNYYTHQVYGTLTHTRPITIGRSSKADITLRNAAISNVHLRIEWDDASASGRITDLNSANGTYIGEGQRIAANVPTPLEPGEPFYLATIDLGFVLRAGS
jgi:hypothetical protein